MGKDRARNYGSAFFWEKKGGFVAKGYTVQVPEVYGIATGEYARVSRVATFG
jgi:hypothetical protein